MLGDKLKELRLSKKLTQKQIAEYLGINQTSYGDYEHGFYEPSITNLKKLARFYRISIDYLLDYSSSKLDVDFLKARIKELDIEQKEELLIKILEAIIEECK